MSEPRYYEYRVEEVRLPEKMAPDLQKWLNALAAEGWRLVAVENPYFFLEREAHGDVPPPPSKPTRDQKPMSDYL